jgi:hypothetical protein
VKELKFQIGQSTTCPEAGMQRDAYQVVAFPNGALKIPIHGPGRQHLMTTEPNTIVQAIDVAMLTS